MKRTQSPDAGVPTDHDADRMDEEHAAPERDAVPELIPKGDALDEAKQVVRHVNAPAPRQAAQPPATVPHYSTDRSETV